jgi:predicted  nucleic acid-binding Zn-ribbon protein
MREGHPLLALQRLDAGADALRARRAGLPEREALRERGVERAALANRREELREQLTALDREERGAEARLADVVARIRDVERTLYSGKVTSPRELQGLQLELESFQRRRGEHETDELAVLARQEEAEHETARIDARHAEIDREEAALRAALAAEESRIDAELAALVASRGALVPRVAPAVLAVYEKLRSSPRLAGRVTAPLADRMCGGCNVVLPISVAAKARAETESAVTCPRCSRILLP